MITDYRLAGEAPQMGRNLFTKQDTKMSLWPATTNPGVTGVESTFSNYTESDYSTEFDFVGGLGWESKSVATDLVIGQDYTFSFDFTSPDYSSRLAVAGNGIRLELRDAPPDGNINSTAVKKTLSLPYTAGTSRQKFTFTATSNTMYLCFNFGYLTDGGAALHFKFANFKFEFGTTATAWTPAPEDSPNLLRNSAFSKDTSYWVVGNSNVTMTKDANITHNGRPSVMIKTRGNGFDGIKSDGYTLPFKNNTTYTMSFWLYRDSTSPEGDMTRTIRFYAPESDSSGVLKWNVISINTSDLPDKTWKKFNFTFTTGGTATGFNCFQVDFYNSPTTESTIWTTEIKFEEGDKATDWTPAPEDLMSGLDRQPLAMSQKTIIDWNDSLSITALIKPNISLTQKYDPASQTYTPDYGSTNLVLTASLFKSNSTTDIINDGNVKSIKWYRKTPKDSEVEVVTNLYYIVNGKTCTRKANLDNSYGSIEFRVEIVYNDPISGQDITVQNTATAHVVQDAGGVNKAVMTMNGSPNLVNGKPVFVESKTNFGENLLKNSRYFKDLTSWGLTMGSGTTGSFGIVSDATYGNILSGTYSGGTNWWVIQHHYYQYWKKKFTVGSPYTVTVLMKSTMDVSISVRDGNGTNIVLDSFSVPSTSGAWAKVTFTRNANIEGNNPDFYVTKSGSTPGDIQIAYVKLEEGDTATPWSIAQADRPSITQATADSNWIWRRYGVPTTFPSRAPLYEDIRSLLMNDERLVAEKDSLVNNPAGAGEDYYIGYLGTAVYVPEARTMPLSFHRDDTASVYVNNVRTYNTPDGTLSGESSTTVNLIAGWNTLEILYFEKTGNDGIWNVATGAKQLLSNAADLSGMHTYPGRVYGTLMEDGWYRFPLVSGQTNEILQDITRSVLQGSTYTQSILFRTDSTSLTFKFTFFESNGTGHHSVTTTFTDLGNGVKRAAGTYTMGSTMLRAVDMNGFTWSNGTYVEFKNPKLELGNTATEFSRAPEDVAPSILKTHVDKVNAFYAAPFETYLTNLTATCHLWRASIEDTTNVTYQWYKKDDSVTTDQGGGVGWLKLTGSSPESGYNLDTLVIPGSAVSEREVYKCVITDTYISSNTANQKFTGYVTVSNAQDPLEIRVSSSVGNTFKNGQGQTTLTAGVFRNDIELDLAGTEFTYKWYKYNKDGVKDTSWNTVGYKTGKKLVVTSEDITEKSTFSVEVID